MSFRNIIDQDNVKHIIAGQIRSGRIPHAYLFLGPDGVGRKKTALEFAKALNCQSPGDAGPCDHCLSCQKVEHGSHPDVQLVDFSYQARLENKDIEKQKTLKIDTIRALQHEVSLKPTEGKWKVFIIEPAEKITLDAANCLLKTLEEPPQWTVLILLARHRENLPSTIVSRTQILRFKPLPEKEIAAFLSARHGIGPARASEIASLSEGSLSAALNLLREKDSAGESLWAKIRSCSLSASELLSEGQQNARNAAEFLDELLAEAKNDFRIAPLLNRRAVESIIHSKSCLERNANPQMVLDVLLLKLAAEQAKDANS